MRFLRSLRGGADEGSAAAGRSRGEAEGTLEGDAGAGPGADPPDESRDAELEEEFEAGLSELARRQVRFARYAWAPPRQLDRRGRWVLTDAADAVGQDGKPVGLRVGEGLELDEGGEHEPDRRRWRFVRVKDGRTVYLVAGPDGGFPDGLERPRGGREGS